MNTNPACRLRFTLLIFVSSILTTVPSFGQCESSQLQSTAYFTGNCGKFTFQSAIGNLTSTYGRCGNFIFSPPFTGGDFLTSIEYTVPTAFHIKPNPAYDRLDVIYESNLTVEHVNILNAAGQLLIRINSKQFSRSIDLQSMVPGLYFIQVIFPNTKPITQKFIKI